jgi:hypothetical protein
LDAVKLFVTYTLLVATILDVDILLVTNTLELITLPEAVTFVDTILAALTLVVT